MALRAEQQASGEQPSRDHLPVKAITRKTSLADVEDLVATPPRAHLAYVRAGAVDALAVAFRREGDTWLVRPPSRASVPPDAPVSLVVDDGRYYFDLRGFRASGTLAAARDDGWRPLAVERVTGWDYGTLRSRETRA